ncbi:DUF2934 domain-containing protein [Rhizobium oryzicola]|uniref:DUF2934 domain-containing protein n=1 Tax=Rhizobium oryzicola TaxID=1232668 RepID=A0ABT8T0G2_9HYPH|nr:DUF2934 domain-containing protein [Rhizobium oryzicola]MDO1584250.1 DUF2934 domain-containing protein [Rhizobium oryzicola]
MAESENWIRQRAYALWEEEGYPHGKDAVHWERAKQEYLLFGKPAQSANKGEKETPTSRRKASKPAAAAIVEPAAKPARAKAAAAKKSAVVEEPAKPVPKRRPKKAEATG